VTGPTAYILTCLAGLAVGWAITVPVHRYKELRPLCPRDVAAEHRPDQASARAAYRRARCAGCHRPAGWRDVMPVLSWVKGCPGCGNGWPATVVATQLAVPVAMAFTVGTFGDARVMLPFLWLVVVLCAIAVIDLRIWLIPWWLPWVGATVGIALIAGASLALDAARHLGYAVAGGVVAFLVFFLLWFVAPGKLGFGDVRLSVLLGMFLAWLHPALPVYGLLFAGLLGTAMGVISLAARRGSHFPFGPALATGAMTAVWLHEPILRNLYG
jgi:leader peptidase (prepilin peptidase) / N-methyltransferase